MNIILLSALCTSLFGLTGQFIATATSIDPDYDGSIHDDDANILMWQELKKQVQQIEKNRASDLKRIQKLENDNKQLRADLDRLAKRKPSGRDGNATRGKTSSGRRPRRSAKTDSEEKSVEFLPAEYQHAYEDEETIDDPEVQFGQFLEVEEPLETVQEANEEQHKIEELSDQVKVLTERVSSMNGCCNRSEYEYGPDAQLSSSADLIYPNADVDQLKERVHHAGISLAQLQTLQYEMRDQQKWLIFQIEQINNDMSNMDEDRQKIWTTLKKETEEKAQAKSSLSEEDNQNQNHSDWESSGELDASGWQTANFVDEAGVLRLTADSPSPKLEEVEKTARDAYSIVMQLKTKLDVIDKDLSKAVARFKNIEKSQLSQSELNAFTQTLDFVQEALVNVTSRLLENELVQDKHQNQVQADLADMIKRLRLLSLQTEKARHLAQVVKDHQTDHFSAIQQFRQDLNALETNVLKLGMKLTNFQTDVMNATLSSYKESNKDLQQDVQIADLYNRIDRIDGKFPEIHQTMKDLAGSLRSKAERAEVKNIGADVQKLTEKFQVTTEFNTSIATVAEAVRVLEAQLPTDCSSVPYRVAHLRDGTYVIKPKGSPKAIMVYCQTDTNPSSADAIGWTVIQKRSAGRENFNRTWDQYRNGFGDPKLEYWIGNEYLHMLTRQTDCLLRIDVWDIYGEYHSAEYGTFKVGSAEEGYRLDIGHYTGNLTDAMQIHNGMQFSAFDVDSDSSSTHCARYYASGWWFSNCQKANLNGVFPLGVIWFSSTTNDWLQLQKTVMKVRPIK